MLYAKGPSGRALVRVEVRRNPDSLLCTVVNDGTNIVLPRDSRANFLQGFGLLEAKLTALCGASFTISDLVELL